MKTPRRIALDRATAEALEDFLDSLDDLNEVQLLSIFATWQARDESAHANAWTAAIAVAARDGLTSEMERAKHAALTWATRGTNAPWPYGVRMEDMWLQLRRQVGPALADAAVATALAGRLDPEAEAVLLEPWRSATGDA